MLLQFFLLSFLCKSTVTFSSTLAPRHNTDKEATVQTATAVAPTAPEKPFPLWLLATPDYPVAAGQRVHLHCKAFTIPKSTTWFWQRLENETWQTKGSGRDLTLTEPEESGLYRCCAERLLPPKSVSQNHTVYIIFMRPTVGENLGIAAFFFSLLGLITTFTILTWLYCQRFGGTMTTSNTASEGFPRAEKPPQQDFPAMDNDRDVYINYSSTNQAYSDLDPTNMTGENVYSSLS